MNFFFARTLKSQCPNFQHIGDEKAMNIEGSSIVITGGCGLIGSTTIDLLLRDYCPARIVILDDLSRGTLANVEQALRDPRVTLVRGDIRDADVVYKVTRGMDAVIHMATMRITAC